MRDRYTERQVEQQINLDVRQAISAIELVRATIDAATTARNLAAKNVQAEQQKYELAGNVEFARRFGNRDRITARALT